MTSPNSSVRLTLPLPAKALSPNAPGQHWSKKARARRDARYAAKMLSMKALREAGRKPPKWERATVRVVFYWRVSRRRDEDNAMASLKAYWDGIVDAGVLVDDAGLTPLPPVFEIDQDRPRVEITVEELP